jgi:CheY-like chemotaxis protein
MRTPARGAGVVALPHRPGPYRIVVADDNTDATDSLAALLRLSGHEVRAAYDGPEAFEAARVFRPQVVILDIGLPGMSGYEVARRIRAQRSAEETSLIALTGYGQAEDINRSREAGFDHHMTKPVDIKALRILLGDASPKASARAGAG